MDSKGALDKIKEAELKAKEMIELARQEARKILQLAQLEREDILRGAQEKAALKSSELKEEIQRDTQNAIAVLKGQAQAQIAKINETAKGNIEAALDFLKTKLK